MAWTFVEGVWCVVISLTLMYFFARHCNVTGPWLKRLNDAAYMAYMLHFYFICVFLWAYAWMVSGRAQVSKIALPLQLVPCIHTHKRLGHYLYTGQQQEGRRLLRGRRIQP